MPTVQGGACLRLLKERSAALPQRHAEDDRSQGVPQSREHRQRAPHDGGEHEHRQDTAASQPGQQG